MSPQRTEKYRFPWRGGNRFRLLADGSRFFPAMIEAVHAARSDIALEFYLFESGGVADSFIAALLEAAARGVRVRVLLDDFGARGLTRADRRRLLDGKVELAFYNPIRYREWRRNLRRDHRKLLLADGERAFVGGAGITDEFADTPSRPHAWHEVMVEAQGPVAGDWLRVFEETWARVTDTPARADAGRSPSEADGQTGRVVVSSGPRGAEIKRSFIHHLRAAHERVWLATAYFVPSWKLLRALRRAARRGVDVRLLLPGPRTDHPAVRHAGRRHYGRLLRHGVRVYEYQPRVLHAKMILCDHWTSIGSSNVDRWNLRWNLEANQEILDEAFAEDVRALFEADFAQSREYHYEQWRLRPWYRRLRERFWGMVDLWLERRR